MKGNIIKYTYYDDTYDSTLVIDTNYGQITTTCSARGEDQKIANRWQGFRFCYRKAEIEYMRRAALKLKNRYIACDSLLQEYMDNKLPYCSNLDETYCKGVNETLISLDKIIFGYWKQYRRVYDQYQSMKDSYGEYCDYWLDLARELKDKHIRLTNFKEAQE